MYDSLTDSGEREILRFGWEQTGILLESGFFGTKGVNYETEQEQV